MRKLAALFPKPSLSGWTAITATALVVVAVVAALVLTGGAKPLLKVGTAQAPTTGKPTPQTGLPYTPAPVPSATPTNGSPDAPTPPDGVDAKGQTISGVTAGAQPVQEADTSSTGNNHPVSSGSWTNPNPPTPDAPKTLPGATNNGGAHPTQVAYNQAPPAGGGTADQAAVLTTTSFVGRFGPEVATARGANKVTATQSSCLDAWVVAHVHDYDGTSGLGTKTLCGLTVAFVGGAAGIDDTTFIGMGKSNLDAGATAVLIGASNPNMVFASARTGSGTDDHGTVLMVAANV